MICQNAYRLKDFSYFACKKDTFRLFSVIVNIHARMAFV